MFRRLTKDDIQFVSSLSPEKKVKKDHECRKARKKKKLDHVERTVFLPRELLLKDISSQLIVSYSNVEKEKVYSALVRIVSSISESKGHPTPSKLPSPFVDDAFYCRDCKKGGVVHGDESSGMMVCVSCGVEKGIASMRLHSYVDQNHITMDEKMSSEGGKKDQIVAIIHQVSGPYCSGDIEFITRIALHYISLGHNLSHASVVASILYATHKDSLLRSGRLEETIIPLSMCEDCGTTFYRRRDRCFHVCRRDERIRRRVVRNDLSSYTK